MIRRLLLFVMIFSVGITFVNPGSIEKVGEPIQVSPEEEFFMAPKWSPDGKFLSVTKSKYNGIYLISLVDNSITTITGELGAGYGYQWSKDGKYIVARVSKYQGRYRYSALKVYEIPSGRVQQISDYVASVPGVPMWSPDGSFVYLSFTDKLRIYPVEGIAKATGTQPGEITYVKKDKIYQYNFKNKAESELISLRDEIAHGKKEVRVINLTVSPDYRKIAFEVIGGPLYTMVLEDKALFEIGRGYRPCWSPDGNYIVYMVTEDDGHQYTASDIFISSWDGVDKFQITNTPDELEMNPSWSPDGKWIAFDTIDDGHIYIQEIKY